MRDFLEDVLSGFVGIIFYIIYTLGGILPFYAAFKDFQADNLFWAALDIFTIVVGVIRGLMFFFGWL
ncbi:hypothetical protein B0187_07995 [Haemophilus paracuniculus]|uniref:Uncharacterized protein n=1 Tax=Haemophilus paracuniculus TaxID=734 RepID=A0A1T0AQW9_9PAST|nr:hypothetical protein [Haemophilus paracuniculus]OOR98594.1 hypothetical protein B0187_07995 [Haemophilus paracuniculus]